MMSCALGRCSLRVAVGIIVSWVPVGDENRLNTVKLSQSLRRPVHAWLTRLRTDGGSSGIMRSAHSSAIGSYGKYVRVVWEDEAARLLLPDPSATEPSNPRSR
jgi:hypothetical protein